MMPSHTPYQALLKPWGRVLEKRDWKGSGHVEAHKVSKGQKRDARVREIDGRLGSEPEKYGVGLMNWKVVLRHSVVNRVRTDLETVLGYLIRGTRRVPEFEVSIIDDVNQLANAPDQCRPFRQMPV